MKPIFRPIELNEQSYNVTFLHQALAALNIKIPAWEVTQGKAGQDTLKEVRNLQSKLKITADASVLLDEPTAAAMATFMTDRGLIATDRSFKVSGTVIDTTGVVKKQQRLLAFDLDLRGVSKFRTLKTQAEILKNSGFEFLGEVVTENKGHYSITFYDWQYQRVERGKADILVYALEGDNIVGHSRVVNVEDYSDAGFVRHLDIVLPLQDQLTEYTVLMHTVNYFLLQNDTNLSNIATSSDQLDFTARELEVDLAHLNIAATAAQIVKKEQNLSHELLYGIGRQHVSLSWTVLFNKQEAELKADITKSVEEKIITKPTDQALSAFLKQIKQAAIQHMLDDKDDDDKNRLTEMLSITLPNEDQRTGFLQALATFKGEANDEFWKIHLPQQPVFKDKPELVSAVQLTQQLTALSGNHQPLVKILQREKGIKSAQALIDFTNDEWLDVAKKAKAPDFIEGEDDTEKEKNYAESLKSRIDATFPTLRIARMVKDNQLGIEKVNVAEGINRFLASSANFDFSKSRIDEDEFQDNIEKIADASSSADAEEITTELQKIQRVFQVSTNPEMMAFLLKNGLHSAYSIASIPRQNFINTFGKKLGDKKAAADAHQRAEFINERVTHAVTHLNQISSDANPATTMSRKANSEVNRVLKDKFANYPNLFGSPDLCECRHCRSVLSPAAYFVDLLRFLELSKFDVVIEGEGKVEHSPYDFLVGKKNENSEIVIPGRRPDLAELALSCENTNTLIPYIDLANEVMEFYVVNDSLGTFPGANTGEATAEELRANPQHTNSKAYEILKDSTFPFSLPFHQPLTAIRTYSDFLNVSRYEVMQAVNPLPDDMPDPSVRKAISAEAFGFSQEEYRLLTREYFVEPEPPLPAIEPHEYFGYDTEDKFKPLRDKSHVRLFMEITGIAYTDLVELVETKFINPHQNTLDYLQKIVTEVTTTYGVSPDVIYKQLKIIHDDQSLDSLTDKNIENAIEALGIDKDNFVNWIDANFNNFQQVITLFEPESKCSLDTTRLRTVGKIYDDPLGESGIEADRWLRFHDFIRLWRKIGWGIHETDLILHALGEQDIKPETIEKLESVLLLQKATQLPLNQLAALWGDIDIYGKQSLYKKLFLNKAAQQIDKVFIADAEGNYLQDVDEELLSHKSAILAAFRLSEEELDAIKDQINKDKDLDPLIENIDKTGLNLHSLSAVYRYIVLAKALKLRVMDVCKLIDLFNATPFNSPGETYKFYKLAASVKTEKFKPAVLEYILTDALPVDSKLGLDANKVRQAAKAIRNGLQVIEQEHLELSQPGTLDELAAKLSLTSEILIAKLTLTYRPEIVSRFMEIINRDSTAVFDTVTKTNLNIADEIKKSTVLAGKFSYIEGSGRLSCIGVMSDAEQQELKLIEPTGDSAFKDAVDQLYVAPEVFINDNFDGFLSFKAVSDAIAASGDVDAARANAQAETMRVLLHRQTSGDKASFEARLAHIYQSFIPVLKKRLQQEIIASHIADLIGLSEAATALLIADEVETLTHQLSTQGFTASYFIGVTWNQPPHPIIQVDNPFVDNTINFSWGNNVPIDGIPNNNFSVRWESYIAPPASDTYTLLVDVAEKDEVFNLYLDGVLILNKEKINEDTSFEIEVELDAAQLHLLKLEYAEEKDNAGIQLRWKTAISAPEIIPSSVAYPEHILTDFIQRANILHRTAYFISGFKISEVELKHFITYSADFSDINFKAITPAHWVRIRDYVALRNSVPQAQALLTDVFSFTKQPLPQDEQLIQEHLNELIDKIYEATAWDKPNIHALITHFFPGAFDTSVPPVVTELSSIIDGFKNEIFLNRFYRVMEIVSKTGLNVETITRWGTVETGYESLVQIAQLIKDIVKAKYDDTEWLKLAGGLSDKIRKQQQQALISYLLVQDSINKNENVPIKDADSLFEYFLIDVQMGSCMNTSRIVQANAAIQLFVNRILLNLEKNIQPDVIDTNRWEWMKNYRVWEANRKVFLWPECWLAPEWRNDRSEFFKEMESHLLQNDITERSVEQGLRNYLMSMNKVANLDVCGMHRENYVGGEKNGDLKFLHVFARTHHQPYEYFYRRWNEYQKWSAWEKVQVDIRSVEDGENSGVHLIPVAWKGRLFLFWPEFMEISKDSGNNREDMHQRAKISIGQQRAEKHWEMRLAWCEYVDGAWSPKQVSKVYLVIPNPSERPVLPYEVRIHPHFDNENKMLVFLVSYHDIYGQCFIILDLHSPIRVSCHTDNSNKPKGVFYENYFSKLKAFFMPLQSFSSNKYLTTTKNHELLSINNKFDLELDSSTQFFYSEGHRTYFANPVGRGIHQSLARRDDVREASLRNTNESASRSKNNDFSFYTLKVDNWHENKLGVGHGPIFSPAPIPNPNPDENDGGTVIPAHPFRGYYALRVYEKCPHEYGKPLKKKLSGIDHILEFHTFHHPYASEFANILNQESIAALMERNIKITPHDDSEQKAEETVFGQNYKPIFSVSKSVYGVIGISVRKHNFFDGPPNSRTAYLENICFDNLGANSLYNWELFFHAPLYIATRLSKNGLFKEALQWFHYIFDPTTSETAESEDDTARFWKVRPFKAESKAMESLESWFRTLQPNDDPENTDKTIAEWLANPFNPHLVASNRPIAYMKYVVIEYVRNLIEWGDSLFRQFTRESVYEAIQLYVIATHVLGKRPEFVPKRGEIKTETYNTLKHQLDDFGNALVSLENMLPYSSAVSSAKPSPGSNLLGFGEALYFCIPANEKLLEYWDTVADRLFKIRHCQDIDGVERNLVLFAPAIDPAALIQARSQGLSLGSILADLSSPPPIYRFSYLMQKANEFCNDVKALGSAVLSALASKDGEELSRLRASQETNMLERVTGIRERQVLAAKVNKENLLKVRETAKLRLKHYKELLGDDSDDPLDPPSLDATLTADGPLPVDTSIPLIETKLEMSLVDSDESGVKIIPKENEQLSKNEDVKLINVSLSGLETIAGLAYAFPKIGVYTAPLGVGAATETGGSYIAAAIHAAASSARGYSSYLSAGASQASIMASYIRRTHDWVLQANLVIREIISLDKQITSADIQIQVAEKELQNHQQQIENSKQVEFFLKDKFTNQELYQWMKEQLLSVYKQSYNLAYDMAKKAEKAYQYELGIETTNFIQYGYWDNSKQGLVAGEKLQLALRQLDKSYIEDNRRELELTKNISLVLLNPTALIELRETGKCVVSLPEELFDLDFQGHYFRRIKSVSISIPCVAGPYTAVNCTLRLLKNTMRINILQKTEGNGDEYVHHIDEAGQWLDDPRFRSNNVPVTSIATSTGQNDAGMFEFNYSDGRYLPFERAGAISDWMIELSTEKALRQFDYATISDVIVHLKYTAREGGEPFKDMAEAHATSFIKNAAEHADQPLLRMFNMKHEFPTEWHKFLHSESEGAEHALSFTIGKEKFPFFVQSSKVIVGKIDVFAKSKHAINQIIFSYIKDGGDVSTTLSRSDDYGELRGYETPEDMGAPDITREMKLSLAVNPGEIEDMFLVLHYSLSD